MALQTILELELTGRGNGWTDVSVDLAGEIRLHYGIAGTGPSDRVASTGTLSFTLDNSEKNSALKRGYYSPNHANKRGGFALGIGVRLTLIPRWASVAIATTSVANPSVVTTATPHGLVTGDRVVIAGHTGSTPAVNGAYTVTVLSSTTYSIPVNVTVGGTGGTSTKENRYYKFVGTLDSIRPAASIVGERTTRCTAVDWMNHAARQKVTGLTVQTGKRSDELFTLLVNSLPTPPAAVEVQTGQDTYAYALDNTRDEANVVLTELQRLAMSELGYIYVKGDTVQGGTLVFESRKRRATATANLDTFVDVADIIDVDAPQTLETVLNKVQVITHPRRIDAAATTVLFKLANAVPIGPGSSIMILGAYRDPLQESARVGGTDMQTPVAGTDFAANTAADGSGTAILLSVVAEFGGNGVRFTVTNNSGLSGFITLLQCRGRGIYDYQNAILEATDTDSTVRYGENVATVDMTYQSDPAVGSEACLYLVNLYRDPTTHVNSVQLFAPNTDVALIERILRREISDRIGIVEQMTGLKTSTDGSATATVGFFINAIDLVIGERDHISASWLLAPADRTAYWLLEIPGRSELDVSTVLGFGQIVGHTDTPHGDDHADVTHGDVAHADVTHSDVAHADGGHQDTAHSDVAHSDSHTDTAHVDSAHQDAAHADSHSDVAHSDTAHVDSAHSDVAHSDVAHSDLHIDVPEHADDVIFDPHQDVHGDTAHADVAHADVAHQDSHTDVAHADSHSDVAHADAAHSDVAHADVAHSDTLHSDVAHADEAHGDTGHSDVAHADVNHSDVVHSDTHADIAHGDV